MDQDLSTTTVGMSEDGYVRVKVWNEEVGTTYVDLTSEQAYTFAGHILELSAQALSLPGSNDK